MGFGTKFRELRENRGLSKAAADEVFGLMRGTCSNWENGYWEVAAFFRVPVRHLTEED